MERRGTRRARELMLAAMLIGLGACAGTAQAADARDPKPAAPRVEGIWAGAIDAEGGEVALRVRIEGDADLARVTVPHFGWYDIAAEIRRTDGGVEIDFSVYSDEARVTLARVGRRLEGQWRGWGAAGTVSLVRTKSADASYTATDFSFSNEGHTFDGTLILPRGEGPFPAVVWAHGSGPVTRDDPIYRSLGVWLVEHGIGALIYDKRPPHPGAGMPMLSRDAVAGVRALREHPRVMPGLIGVGGLSQGGWVAPMAAAQSDDVGFIVGLSAPAVSPGEQNIFNQHNRVRRDFGEDAAREATRALRSVYHAFRTGEGAEHATEELDRASEEVWFKSANELVIWHRRGLPPVPWVFRDALDFDPGPAWRVIRAPVVCVWGGDDQVVPPERSRELIAGWLIDTGHKHHALTIAPKAHHDLRDPPRAPWTMGAVPPEMNAVPRFILGLAASAPETVETRRGPDVDTLHGVDIPDPYHWLEEAGAERDAWARAQDDITRGTYAEDPLALQLRDRMIELSAFAPAPVPVLSGEHRLTHERLPGENYSEIRVQTLDEHARGERSRVLVDPHDHPAAPGESVAVGAPYPSPDGRYAFYGAASASMPECVRVVEIASGTDLTSDAVQIRHWPWRVSWGADSGSYYYVDGATVRRHRLGTSVADDQIVFTTDDEPGPHLAVRASVDGTMLFVTAFHPENDTTKVYAHQIEAGGEPAFGQWDAVITDPPGAYQVVGKQGHRLFVYTTRDAPNGRVVALDLEGSRDPGSWAVIVPERAEPIYDGNHPIRPTVGMFGDRIVALYARQGRLLLRTHDLGGAMLFETEHETFGQHESGLIGDPRVPVVRYDERGMFDPGTAYELDLRTGERAVVATPTTPFDPSAYELTRHRYHAYDGTEIPVFLARRRGLIRDGSNPALITNWAVSGLVVRPMFRPEHHAWMELGGIVVLPAGRGSGEHGRLWHRAGAGRNKATAIDDMAAAAEWLVRTGHSRANRIGMLGASMNAAASAGTVVRHPWNFGAALIQIPRIDLITERWAVEEYGDIHDPGDFRAMMEWMPYPNAEPGLFPPFLVQVGSLDTVTAPFHGYKLAAALGHAQLDTTPIHLHVVWGAGHSQGNGVPLRCETMGLHYCFLARSLGLVSD